MFFTKGNKRPSQNKLRKPDVLKNVGSFKQSLKKKEPKKPQPPQSVVEEPQPPQSVVEEPQPLQPIIEEPQQVVEEENNVQFVVNEIVSSKTKNIIKVDDIILKNYKPTIDKKKKTEVIYHIEKNSKKDISIMSNNCNKNNININIYNKKKGFKESDLIVSARYSRFAVLLENEKNISLTIKKMAAADIPVFVWGSQIPDGWNDELGCYVTEEKLLSELFEKFINNYNDYNPRKYILN